MPRVAVTGIGVISALGMKTAEFWRALQNGESGIRAIEAIDAEQLRFKNVAQVRGFQAQTGPRESTCLHGPVAQFAVLSAGEAIAHANVEWTPLLRENAIVVTGSCMGAGCAEQDGYRELFLRAKSHVHPLTIPLAMDNAGTSQICMYFGIKGPAFYDLDRVCLFGTCLGPSILDGSLRAGATRCRRRK